MTATQAAEHLGESPSNLSFHLRQLAKHGFVEEADDVTISGRARPWRLTSVGFSTAAAQDEDLRSAAEALGDVVIERAVQRHRRWVSHPSVEPAAWNDILGASQTVWWLTQQEAVDLRAEIGSLADRYMDRLADPAQRPADARPVEFLALLHPLDEAPDQV
jgi:DNA-binding transcriptional ArsR family regulator